jgi:hypothetical protein
MQAYMSINAEYEYDRLKQLDSSTRNAEASYKLFRAEYQDSSTREEFRDRVRQRLATEQFAMSESEARSYAKRYLSEAQIAAWARCMTSEAVLLSASQIDKLGFVLKVLWIPPTGVGEAPLTLTLDRGRIEGKKKLERRFVGRRSESFIVKPAADSDRVKVVANIMGISESLGVTLSPSKTPQLVRRSVVQRVILCSMGLPADCAQPPGRIITAGCPSKEEGGGTGMPPEGWLTSIPVEALPSMARVMEAKVIDRFVSQGSDAESLSWQVRPSGDGKALAINCVSQKSMAKATIHLNVNVDFLEYRQ